MASRREAIRCLTAMSPLISGCISIEPPTHSTADRNKKAVSEGWPMWRYDLQNTGCVNHRSAPVEEPTERWAYKFVGSVWGSPAIKENKLYIGSDDNKFRSFDINTGEPVWEYETDGFVESSPTVIGETVYFGSADQNIYALDVETGDEKWRYGTSGKVLSSPAVRGETLFIGSGCYLLECNTSDDPREQDGPGWTLALDRETGELLWSKVVTGGMISSPAVRADSVYIGGSNGLIYSLNAQNGDVEWEFSTDAGIMSSPAIYDGAVYFGNLGGNMFAVNASNASELWCIETGASYISASPAVCQQMETVLIGVPVPPEEERNEDDNAVFYALDTHSGKIEWEYETNALEIGSSAAITDDAIYFGSHYGEDPGVHSINKEGAKNWHYSVQTGVGSSPAITDQGIFFGKAGGEVCALETT